MKDVDASQDVLIDLFEHIGNFFKRLELYVEVPPTAAMTDMIVKIMVEVLSILATATSEIQQSRPSTSIRDFFTPIGLLMSPLGKYLRRLVGKNDLEDALKRLDKLTQEEARMATAEVLKVMHSVDNNVEVVIDGAQREFLSSDMLSLSSIRPDGKEAKAIMQRMEISADEEKRSSSFNLTAVAS